MIRKFTALLFTIIFLFFVKPAVAIDNLSAVCSGGKYDYCSQAPKCGEYPEWNSEWEQRSRELWNPEIFEYCQYKICQGYVPLCCYEMVRTGDKDKCAGYDTLYCLPKQCNQVPDSASKQCAHGAIGNFESQCPNIRSLDPVPLSQRFQNDVLFYLIDSNPAQAATWVPQKYPDIWNLYQQWKRGGGGNPPPPLPTTPPSQPTTPPGQPTTAIPTTTPYIPYQPPIGYPTSLPGTTISPPVYNPPNNPPYNPPYNPPVFPSSVPSNIFGTPSHAKPTTLVPLPYIFSITSPIKTIQAVKNNIVNGVTTMSKGLYERFIYFIENYLP